MLYLDGTTLQGDVATDRVCPVSDVNSCISKYHFTAIETATGLRDIEDGILGMWSGNEVGLQEKYSRALFVPEMVKDGSITESVFSFHLSGLTGQSYLDFGTPNPAAMKGDPSEIIYIPNQSNQVYWQNEVSGFRFTSNSDNTADQAFTKADALTDTGASCISGPSSDVEKITDGIWSAIGKFTTVESSSGWGQ